MSRTVIALLLVWKSDGGEVQKAVRVSLNGFGLCIVVALRLQILAAPMCVAYWSNSSNDDSLL
jgi:hypothetical protein